jgi:hypothetical protein
VYNPVQADTARDEYLQLRALRYVGWLFGGCDMGIDWLPAQSHAHTTQGETLGVFEPTFIANEGRCVACLRRRLIVRARVLRSSELVSALVCGVRCRRARKPGSEVGWGRGRNNLSSSFRMNMGFNMAATGVPVMVMERFQVLLGQLAEIWLLTNTGASAGTLPFHARRATSRPSTSIEIWEAVWSAFLRPCEKFDGVRWRSEAEQ